MIKISKKIELPVFSDTRGSLSFLESFNHLPFDVNKVVLLAPSSAVPFELKYGNDIALASLNGNIIVHTLDGEISSSHGLSNPRELLVIPSTTSVTIDFCTSSSVLLMSRI